MSDIQTFDQAIVEQWRVRCATAEAEIARLKALLNDKQYIQCKADYLRGHLSHAGWLESRERGALEGKK